MPARRLISCALFPAALVFIFAVLLFSYPASGAGPLRVVQALVDDPLENADAVIISADSRHLYAVGHSALVVFERDFATGTTRFLEAHYNGHGGVKALRGATSLALSPDGQFIYVASPQVRRSGDYDTAGVATFARDSETGALSFLGTDTLWSPSDTNQTVNLAMAPDGNVLYLVSTADLCLFIFDRDFDDGSLMLSTMLELDGPLSNVFLQTSADSDHVYLLHDQQISLLVPSQYSFGPEQTNGRRGVQGMAQGQSLVISPDGRHVYVLSPSEPGFDGDGTVVIFARNVENGRLDYLSTLHDPSRIELNGATRGVISGDGSFLYIALDAERSSTATSAVAVLERDVSSGDLTFVELIGDDDFNRGQALALTAEDNLIYMGSFQGKTLFPFRRDVSDGLLEPADDPDDPSSGTGLTRGAVAVAASPGGEHLYVAGHFNHAVTTYKRLEDGSLELASTLNAAVDGADGLRGARAIAVSPQGSWVFAGGDGATVAVLERNTETGALRQHAVRSDGVTEGLAVSPNGRHVYAVGQSSGTRIFEVTASGEIDEIEMETPSRRELGSLTRPRAVAVSSDGRLVYVAGFYDCGTPEEYDDFDSLTVFRRHLERGTLTPRGVLVLGGNSVDRFPPHLVVAPEGRQVYLGRPKGNSVRVITHDAAGNQLRSVQTVAQGQGGVLGLSQPRGMVLSPTGERLYVAGRGANAVAVFDRDRRGRLSFVGATSESDTDVEGELLRPLGLAVTPDGYLHAVSLRSSGVTVLTPAQ